MQTVKYVPICVSIFCALWKVLAGEQRQNRPSTARPRAHHTLHDELKATSAVPPELGAARAAGSPCKPGASLLREPAGRHFGFVI